MKQRIHFARFTCPLSVCGVNTERPVVLATHKVTQVTCERCWNTRYMKHVYARLRQARKDKAK